MYNNSIKDPTRNPYPLSKIEVETLYINLQKDLQFIAEMAGTSRQRLARWMEYWGIPRRGTIESAKLKRIQQGKERGPNWQGGRWYAKHHKTWYVYAPHHPNCKHNGGVEEHRLVAEKKIGRLLKEDEVVHHLFEDRNDNRPSMLIVLTKSEHMKLHRILGEVGIAFLAQGHFEETISFLSEEQQTLIRKVYDNDRDLWKFIRPEYLQERGWNGTKSTS